MSKPLLSKFWLKGKVWKVQYEGIRMVCYKCGRLDHQESECPALLQADIETSQPMVDQLQGISTHSKPNPSRPENGEDFGSWMLVKKPVRKRTPRTEKTTTVVGKTTPSGHTVGEKVNPGKSGPTLASVTAATNLGENHGTGSRFSILKMQDMDTDKASEDMVEDTREILGEKESNLLGRSQENQLSQQLRETIPRVASFNIGRRSANFQSPTNPRAPTKVYQEKCKLVQQLTRRALIDSNTESGTEPNLATLINNNSRKENSPLIFQAQPQANKKITESHDKQSPMPNHPIDIPHEPAPECDQINGAHGEDFVCGTANGVPISGHSRPPDSHPRSENGNMESSSTGANSNNVTSQ